MLLRIEQVQACLICDAVGSSVARLTRHIMQDYKYKLVLWKHSVWTYFIVSMKVLRLETVYITLEKPVCVIISISSNTNNMRFNMRHA
jgi:hypothetical protein